MNRTVFILTGVFVLSAGLAVVLGSQVPEQYLTVSFGFAAGTLIGAVIGGVGVLLVLRTRSQRETESRVSLQLTADQAHTLFKALERQQAAPETLSASARGERQFKAVGGAEISPYDSPDV
jgi:uncharacterized membrane protein YccC